MIFSFVCLPFRAILTVFDQLHLKPCALYYVYSFLTHFFIRTDNATSEIDLTTTQLWLAKNSKTVLELKIARWELCSRMDHISFRTPIREQCSYVFRLLDISQFPTILIDRMMPYKSQLTALFTKFSSSTSKILNKHLK